MSGDVISDQVFRMAVRTKGLRRDEVIKMADLSGVAPFAAQIPRDVAATMTRDELFFSVWSLRTHSVVELLTRIPQTTKARLAKEVRTMTSLFDGFSY